MRFWLTVAFLIVATVGLPSRLVAQSRVTVGSHPHGSTRGPHSGPSRPSPPSINQPFRSTLSFRPGPFVNGHRPLPVCSSLFGLILFDPYWWLAPDTVDLTTMLPAPVPSSEPPPLTGGLQLDVEPRRALVYVDGFYAGTVDAFSGYYHHLETTAGPHRIFLVAPDYDPLVVDVMVPVGRTTTYRGSMNRAQGR